MMCRWMLIVLLGLILLSCRLPASLSPATDTVIHSGIEGMVTIAPMCPVMRADQPCPDKSYQATLTVLNSAGNKVTQFQTDTNGKYQIALAPGDYVLHPESPNIMPHAGDIPFTVTENEYTTLDVVYDSGIR